jgi:putative oxygen-independent coproporphyrinogen III oxidase
VFDGFGLYVHVPYCRTKCPYCDFNVVATARWPERRYTNALVAELGHYAQSPPFRGKRLESVFFGGGTPSLFTPGTIERVIREARALFVMPADAEVSLEANPETVSDETLAGYRQAGVNRISFGIESFRPALLKRLGRLQTAAETALAVPMARQAGFANVSIDLMFAVPGQSLADWRADLDTAISHRPEHVSAYNLTYEEGTPFFELRRRGRLVPLDDDLEAAMFEEARARLGRAGYRAYEVSNFALPGFESGHNQNYWHAGAYLGIGAGAHSHEPLGRRARRWSNEREPEAYVRRISSARDAVSVREVVEPPSAAGEYVFLHLRTIEGLAEERFRARFGASLEETFPEVRRMLADDLLERTTRDRIALTRRGLLLADSVFASFL